MVSLFFLLLDFPFLHLFLAGLTLSESELSSSPESIRTSCSVSCCAVCGLSAPSCVPCIRDAVSRGLSALCLACAMSCSTLSCISLFSSGVNAACVCSANCPSSQFPWLLISGVCLPAVPGNTAVKPLTPGSIALPLRLSVGGDLLVDCPPADCVLSCLPPSDCPWVWSDLVGCPPGGLFHPCELFSCGQVLDLLELSCIQTWLISLVCWPLLVAQLVLSSPFLPFYM